MGTNSRIPLEAPEPERYELQEAPAYRFPVERRVFLQTVAGGFLLLAVGRPDAAGQRPASQSAIDARIRFGTDGRITVYNGKVEEGQGARTEIAMAAAEELGVAMDAIHVQMADTALTPDDGITAGSRTTPYTLPPVREAAAAGRALLLRYAAQQWKVDTASLTVAGGKVTDARGGRSLSYADLAKDADFLRTQAKPSGIALSGPAGWQVLGKSMGRMNGRDVVTGVLQYPSDVQRPGMLYGAVLRPPAYGATLQALELGGAPQLEGVTVVRDKDFIGFVAPTAFGARQAADLAEERAKWTVPPAVAQENLWEHFRKTAEGKGPGADPGVVAALARSHKTLSATFEVPYVQHAPMEPRAAAAEWSGNQLTVYTGASNPFRVRQDLAQAFGLQQEQVRVIVPDFGGGFGGKHTGEAALEAARLSKEVQRPVHLRWTRQEEFAWAYCRPAALIWVRAGIDAEGKLSAWEFLNYNSGASGLRSPYAVAALREEFLRTDSPLRQGSYRALASTANNFARETAMDELAAATGQDPLEFRMAHLKDQRIRAVLAAAAERFGWTNRGSRTTANRGVGIACGTEKNSVVATIAEVELDARTGVPTVLELCTAYECGAILNPAGLLQQAKVDAS
ncbi:MAG: molybdopterin-dependent oxidoreductase, partial [Bryobacterales bacterium]|nr:molybdopterin-dependent oxidoreductase [Bryobacterales bacterium]